MNKLYRAKFGFMETEIDEKGRGVNFWIGQDTVICIEHEPKLKYWEEINIKELQNEEN